jgi:DNA-binding Xre family transcriptional regulator
MELAAAPVQDVHMPWRTNRKLKEDRSSRSPYATTHMRAWREHRNKTLEVMAEKCGIKHGQLSRIERGLQPYRQTILETYARELDCSVVDLIVRDPDEAEDVLSLWSKLDGRGRKMVAGMLKSAAE